MILGDSLVADDHTEDVLDSFAVDDNSAKEDIPQLPPGILPNASNN